MNVSRRAPEREPRPVPAGMLTMLLGNVFPSLVSLASGPILAQSLGVEGRGAVAAAIAPFALVVALVTFGLPEAVTYAVARSPRLAKNALRAGAWLLLVAGVVAVGLVVLASPALSGGDPDIRRLMLLAAGAIVPNVLVGALRGVASALQRWDAVMHQKVLGATLKLALLVPFWLTGNLTPVVATLIIAAVPVLGALPYLVLLRRLPPAEPGPHPEVGGRRLLSYGGRTWAGSVSGIVHARVDQTLVTPLAGPVEMGLYAVAVTVAELPMMIHAAVRDVNFVAEAAGERDDRLAATARISTLLTGAGALAVAGTMWWWLPLLFGEDFRAAVPVAGVLLLAVLLGVPGSIAGSALSGRGRPGLRSATLAVASIVNIVIILLVVPTWGALGAGWATVASNLTQGSLCIFLVRRLYGIPVRAFYGIRRTDLVVLRRFAGVVVRALQDRVGRARRAH